MERFEAKLKDFQGSVPRAATELAKDWRMDRSLRRLEAMMIAVDKESLLLVSGTGDVIQPSDGVAAIGSGAGGEEERADAEDEGDGGHQDGAEAEFGGFDGGFGDGAALLEELLGELDDEDRVFDGEADEHDEADLDVDVVDEAASGDERERSEDRHGDGEQDDERQREALVLGGEGEIDDEQAQAKAKTK